MLRHFRVISLLYHMLPIQKATNEVIAAKEALKKANLRLKAQLKLRKQLLPANTKAYGFHHPKVKVDFHRAQVSHHRARVDAETLSQSRTKSTFMVKWYQAWINWHQAQVELHQIIANVCQKEADILDLWNLNPNKFYQVEPHVLFRWSQELVDAYAKIRAATWDDFVKWSWINFLSIAWKQSMYSSEMTKALAEIQYRRDWKEALVMNVAWDQAKQKTG